MIEKDITIDITEHSLAATVCLPQENTRFPMVVLIHGSGPLDRNENAKGVKLNVFNTIAHHLVQYGIGSIRFDKRGCGKSTGHYHSASHTDFVNDAQGVIDYLVESEFCNKEQIYLLGHSEGTIIAPQLSRNNPRVAGIILLCPFVQPLDHILREQATQIANDLKNLSGIKGTLIRGIMKLVGDPLSTQDRLIQRLKASTTPTIKYRLKTINAGWFRELFELDYKVIFRHVACPMLVIGGEKDLQCDPHDVERIKQLSNSDMETHVISNMTHILRCDDQPASFFNYKKLFKQPIELQVLQLTQAWLEKQIQYSVTKPWSEKDHLVLT